MLKRGKGFGDVREVGLEVASRIGWLAYIRKHGEPRYQTRLFSFAFASIVSLERLLQQFREGVLPAVCLVVGGLIIVGLYLVWMRIMCLVIACNILV